MKDEKEIVEYIETQMKPKDTDILQQSELEWEFMRAFNIFHFLFNQDDRAEIYAESFGAGENLMSVIYRHVKKRYPDLGWTDAMDEEIDKMDKILGAHLLKKEQEEK